MPKQLTEYQLGCIWSWRYPKPVLTYKKIAKKMRKNESTVQRAFHRMKKRGGPHRKKGSGRPRVTTKRHDKHMVVAAKRNPFASSKQIKNKLQLTASDRTIRRRLVKAGLKSYHTVKKPYINEKNRKRRLVWAKNHRNWTVQKWRRVLFTDESPFTLRYQGKRLVRRPVGQALNPRYCRGSIKHDKKINVWGCFAYNGVGKFYRVKGILEKNQMRQILIRQMKPSLRELVGLEHGILQQDNDPKHKSNVCQNYLKNQNINVLPWPSQSPDLNCIENLWHKLNSECMERKCKNEEELFKLLQKAWNNLDKNYLKNLVNSMPRRIEAVIKSKGFPTKY